MIAEKLGKPIKVFLGNLLFEGVQLAVVDGKLRIGGNTSILSPVYRDEIMRRKEHLIELLTPQPPPALRPYCYRLLPVNQLRTALDVAAQERVEVWHMPVNGGWLVGPTGHNDGWRNGAATTRQRRAAIQSELQRVDQSTLTGGG